MKRYAWITSAAACAAMISSMTAAAPAAAAPTPVAYYSNCSAARSAGAAPIYRGQDGYRSALDRDGDGVACETGGSGSAPQVVPTPNTPSPRIAPRPVPPVRVAPPRPPYRAHKPLGFITSWPAFLPVPDVRFGDYCSSFRNQDGYTANLQHAFCVRVRGTGAYVWAPERRLTPQDPNVTLNAAGDRCVNRDAMARNSRGVILFCNATVGGRTPVILRYQLIPY